MVLFPSKNHTKTYAFNPVFFVEYAERIHEVIQTESTFYLFLYHGEKAGTAALLSLEHQSMCRSSTAGSQDTANFRHLQYNGNRSHFSKKI